MLDLILDPSVVLGCLVALAIVTPLGALLAWKRCPAARRRLTAALGAAGPMALALYGVQALLVVALGHDSIWTALVFFAVCAGLGIGFGGWIRGEPTSTREQ